MINSLDWYLISDFSFSLAQWWRLVRFFWFFAKKRLEPNKTGLVWTDSQFDSGYNNKEYYFPVWLNFWIKTGPWTPLVFITQYDDLRTRRLWRHKNHIMYYIYIMYVYKWRWHIIPLPTSSDYSFEIIVSFDKLIKVSKLHTSPPPFAFSVLLLLLFFFFLSSLSYLF